MGSNKSKIRGRVNYNTRKDYNNFKKQYPTSDTTYEEFKAIIKRSNLLIRDAILDNPLGFKLPYQMGYIAVDKFKPSKKFVAIDWVNSKKFKKRIPLTNLHSFGYTFKIKLYKNPGTKPLIGYNMKPHRLINRKMAENVLEEKREYISIDKTYFSRRFRIDKIIKQP